MKNYQNDYLSEFEQEFELDDEMTENSDEFENFESAEDEAEFETNDEGDYLSEWEGEYEAENEFENTPEGGYEARLFEIFSNNYENEFEFENDFNEVMYEIERDFFWKKIKKWGKKLAPLAKSALSVIPGGGNLMSAIKQITKDPRGLLKTLAMKFGPAALNSIIPGSGAVLGAVMGNNEMDDTSAARQAARDTVALARDAYSNFADEIGRTDLRKSLPQATTQMNDLARKAFKRAHQTVRNGSRRKQFTIVNRKTENVTIQGRPHKKVTILYKPVVG